jgi:2-dehydropantoate 2-reductase
MALGVHIPEEMIDRRLAAVGAVYGHKMSMLRDLERGRPLEIDALVTAVSELGRRTGIATPAIDIVLALAQERGRQAGLYSNPLGREE